MGFSLHIFLRLGSYKNSSKRYNFVCFTHITKTKKLHLFDLFFIKPIFICSKVRHPFICSWYELFFNGNLPSNGLYSSVFYRSMYLQMLVINMETRITGIRGNAADAISRKKAFKVFVYFFLNLSHCIKIKRKVNRCLKIIHFLKIIAAFVIKVIILLFLCCIAIWVIPIIYTAINIKSHFYLYIFSCYNNYI